MSGKAMGVLQFRCNICGHYGQVPMSLLSREQASCPVCESTVRMRAMMNTLSEELFGESLVLSDFPKQKKLKGLGMSDWPGYAQILSKKLGYQNTFFHQKPYLDITNIAPELEGSLDFLISTDVFEHVAPPVSRAFVNARKLLKEDGVFVFSVPYKTDGETLEHFPELFDYRIDADGLHPTLINVTADGREQVFENLVFHGGPGETLEMRVFSQASLEQALTQAGFTSVDFYARHYFDFGIYWPVLRGVPIAARLGGKRQARNDKLPFCIDDWGPQETLLNQTFNVQPNGASALWVSGENLQFIKALRFGSTVIDALTVASTGQVVSAAIAPHLLARVGAFSVYAVTDTGPDYLIGKFQVRAQV